MSSFVFNITFDCDDPERLSDFWSAVTGYERTELIPGELARLRAPDPRGVRHLLFFKVPEPKVSKSRVHVDLATRDRDAEVERLRTLGATVLQEKPIVVMADPEGNEFCIG
jgi:predicted enzyme related to lactoylglutathione lyase